MRLLICAALAVMVAGCADEVSPPVEKVGPLPQQPPRGPTEGELFAQGYRLIEQQYERATTRAAEICLALFPVPPNASPAEAARARALNADCYDTRASAAGDRYRRDMDRFTSIWSRQR